MTPAASAASPTIRTADFQRLVPERNPTSPPTPASTTTARTALQATATVPLASRNGTSGTNAPTEKIANEDSAAPTGEPRSVGSSPSSSRTSVSTACSGFLSSSAAVRLACSVESPFCLKMSAQLGRLLLGRLLDLAPLQLHLARQEVALARHRGVLAGRHREGAGEQPGEAGDDHRARLDAGAGDAEDEREVRDEPVVHAEDGGADRARGAARSGASARATAMRARASVGWPWLMPAEGRRWARSSSAMAVASPPWASYLSASPASASSTIGTTAAAAEAPREPDERADPRRGAVGREGDRLLLELPPPHLGVAPLGVGDLAEGRAFAASFSYFASPS